MLPNVAAMPTTWLALARLGAIMVPVNIAYTPRELEYVVTDSESTFLVIHDECLPALDGNGAIAFGTGQREHIRGRWRQRATLSVVGRHRA